MSGAGYSGEPVPEIVAQGGDEMIESGISA